MVRIVNWILTRRCNLRCEYCGIVKVAGDRTIEYFKKNEISTERVITLLNKFIKYNPNIFHIFYGGEPFLRGDLSNIIKFCNENDILYTIISNCTSDIKPKIIKVMNDVGGFRGFTGSIDPILLMNPAEGHSQLKSAAGFKFLMWMKNHVKDVVAEVTMTKENMEYTYDLLKLLSNGGICSSLTAIDVNKNYTYDFSAYSDTNRLIKDSLKLKELYHKIMTDDSLLIHMKDEIIPTLFRYISSDYNCEMEKSIHNLTIDADGSIRTCLRMRGHHMKDHYSDRNILRECVDGSYDLNYYVSAHMKYDREENCKGCNHTCVMMSNYINYHNNEQNKILDH